MTARRRRACARAPKRCRPCFRRSPRAERANELNEKPTMRRPQRLIAATVLIALSGALAGCGGGMGNFDPSDMLDFLDTKKKLPGERKPVFPEGVPGLEQGVPKDLYKGSRQQQIDEQNAAGRGCAAPPPQEPKSKAPRNPRASRPAAAAARARGEPPPPIPMPRPRKRAAPPPRRRRRSRRRSCASAPPRRRPTSRRLNRRRPRSPPNNPPRRSRRRCRAARFTRLDFCVTSSFD